MSAKARYSYAVLRYVHDVGTEEFVNIGVVALVDDVLLYAKFKSTIKRLKSTFPSLNSDAYKARISSLQDRYESLAGMRFPWERSASTDVDLRLILSQFFPADDSSFQWSGIGSGISSNKNKIIASLYERFVAKHEIEGAARRKDEDVWRKFKLALESRQVLPYLEQKVIAVPDDHVRFEHAWKNGLWHCFEPISFDLATEDGIKEKALRWLGQLESVKNASDIFKVYFLVGAPSSEALESAYLHALSLLQKGYSASVVLEKDASEFSAQVANDMIASRADNKDRS